MHKCEGEGGLLYEVNQDQNYHISANLYSDFCFRMWSYQHTECIQDIL